MTGMGLTRRQSDTLAFIREHLGRHGFAPTYDEIAAGLGMRGKGHVAEMVRALVERGYVVKLRNRARSLAVVDHGDVATPSLNALLALLPTGTALKLRQFCTARDEDPVAVFADAVALHMDVIERDEAMEATKCL